MNRIFFTSFLFLGYFLTPFYLTAQISGDTYAKARQTKKANWVFTFAEAPGFASLGKEGITFDLMSAFERWVETKQGISVSVSYRSEESSDFTKFLEVVRNARGGVFGLSNTTITDARKRFYNFSPPYITNIGMIITSDKAPTLSSLSGIAQTFSGMTAVTVKNSTNEKRILAIKKKYYPSLKVEYVSSFSKALDMVEADPKKFTNVDFTYYFDAIQHRRPIKRHEAGDDSTEEFGIIMPKTNDWAVPLAQFMNEFVGSMEYKKIVAGNLGQSAMKFFETLK